ncbi:MAG TPA: helix-turn-helix domain-containing protein [Lunatimonas sp.]|nr:helix-turn-helix domain-containing protein [Lunatimonas sp.]
METTDYRIVGLNKIFSPEELINITECQTQSISILSYFATSLFDKNKIDDVLWDIAENCISKLGLEDCVIYLLDERKDHLIQKAAYGNKNQGQRKILSPIYIRVGTGIVGNVAKTGKAEIIGDVFVDKRYILDDMQRGSELAVPMLLGDKIIGVIDSEHSEKFFFSDSHLYLFELIAQLTVRKLAHVSKISKSSFTNDNAYFKQLCVLLTEEKIYKDAELSLSTVANRLNISANYLSQLINSLSSRNFSDLINFYRVEEAMNCLTHSDFVDYTMEGIGYEVGFNSKSSFYSAFKKQTGITPTQFKKSKKMS